MTKIILLAAVVAGAVGAGAQAPVAEHGDSHPRVYTDFNGQLNGVQGLFPAADEAVCDAATMPDQTAIAPGSYSNPVVFCRYTNLMSSVPGINTLQSQRGAAGVVTSGIYMGDSVIFGQGITNGMTLGVTKTGAGDNNLEYLYQNAIPAWVRPSDEGNKTLGLGQTELPGTYSGEVSGAGGIGATDVATRPTSGNRLQGVGRLLVQSTPIYTGVATSVDNTPTGMAPKKIHVTPAMPRTMVSTAVGQLTSACLPLLTPANTGSSCTVTVKVQSGAFAADSLVEFTGLYQNQARLRTVTTRGGEATLTFDAHDEIPAGASVYQGQRYGSATPSCTGTGVDFLANDVVTSATTLKYPFQVVGCEDVNTLDVVQFNTISVNSRGETSRLDLGGVVLGTSSVFLPLSAREDVLSVYTPGDGFYSYIGQTVTIAGSSNTTFNGACRVTGFTNDGVGFLCEKAGSGTAQDRTTTGVAVSLGTTGFGNGQLTVSAVAQVQDVRDPYSTPIHQVDGYFVLEANEMNLTRGAGVYEAHHYAQSWSEATAYQQVSDPYFGAENQGYLAILQGLATSGFSSINSGPAKLYRTLGGTHAPPEAYNARGFFQDVLHSRDAPIRAGSGLHIGCPIAGCRADRSYVYDAIDLDDGDGHPLVMPYFPATGDFQIASRSGALHFQTDERGNAVSLRFQYFPVVRFEQPLHTEGTAPTGGCTQVGWEFTDDGHASFCDGKVWVQKI